MTLVEIVVESVEHLMFFYIVESMYIIFNQISSSKFFSNTAT